MNYYSLSPTRPLAGGSAGRIISRKNSHLSLEAETRSPVRGRNGRDHLKFALRNNSNLFGRPIDTVLLEFTEHLTLPLSDNLDRLLRYETSVHR